MKLSTVSALIAISVLFPLVCRATQAPSPEVQASLTPKPPSRTPRSRPASLREEEEEGFLPSPPSPRTRTASDPYFLRRCVLGVLALAAAAAIVILLHYSKQHAPLRELREPGTEIKVRVKASKTLPMRICIPGQRYYGDIVHINDGYRLFYNRCSDPSLVHFECPPNTTAPSYTLPTPAQFREDPGRVTDKVGGCTLRLYGEGLSRACENLQSVIAKTLRQDPAFQLLLSEFDRLTDAKDLSTKNLSVPYAKLRDGYLNTVVGFASVSAKPPLASLYTPKERAVISEMMIASIKKRLSCFLIDEAHFSAMIEDATPFLKQIVSIATTPNLSLSSASPNITKTAKRLSDSFEAFLDKYRL